MEALENVRKCARKGCFFSGMDLKDEYSVDAIGPETGLHVVYCRTGTGKCENLHR